MADLVNDLINQNCLDSFSVMLAVFNFETNRAQIKAEFLAIT